MAVNILSTVPPVLYTFTSAKNYGFLFAPMHGRCPIVQSVKMSLYTFQSTPMSAFAMSHLWAPQAKQTQFNSRDELLTHLTNQFSPARILSTTI